MGEEQRNFVQWALQRSPQDRPTVAEMLQHPWITLHQVGAWGRERTQNQRHERIDAGQGLRAHEDMQLQGLCTRDD